MDTIQARRLIKKTFEAPFNKENFVVFIKNLLNKMEEKTFRYLENSFPSAFKEYFFSLERIGKYSDGEHEIDILIVRLKKETSLERARTMQRNFIAWYLKGSRGGKLKDAALVAFVSPDEEDWRFSLVKMEYRIENGKSGGIKVSEEFTPARRWSFLVGKNESSHTAQSRFVPILEDDRHSPTLKDLEDAFNVEPVSKEFFIKYRNLLIRTVDLLDEIVGNDRRVDEHFKKKNVNTVDFAKKLLEQIVFLYFLQKKGWFGVKKNEKWGSGPKNFLRRLINGDYNIQYKNFFNDILEPLFYEALNRKRENDFYEKFNCRIPFLNGGLFEPIGGYDWENVDILLPNELFSNKDGTFEGNGILDIFDLFNFTVKEDEPLEKEVAVDPELLGKLYEKFNAIRPDNFYEYKEALSGGKKSLEKKFNKKFGVYYTPREIVHYMCQESLIYYLSSELEGKVEKGDIEEFIKSGEQFIENEATALDKEERIKEGRQETSDYKLKLPENIRKNARLIDEKLKEIKVCDPAVGSGAFLVGMMHEIVKARRILSGYIGDEEGSTYNFKRKCIENSLYGVDIDPGATEVAKLRLWLSLIVDEEDVERINPLPNLDYKILQGNSLISEFLGINFDGVEDKKLSLGGEIENLIEKFQYEKGRLFNESYKEKKDEIRNRIENLLIEIFEKKLMNQKSFYFSQFENIKRMSLKIESEGERDRFIEEEKRKLHKNIGYDLEKAEREFREYISLGGIKPFFPWKLYFAEVFQEKGGFDVVIGNPPYIQLQKNHGRLANLYEDKGFETFDRMGDIYCLFYEKGLNLLKRGGFLTFITSNKWMRAGYGKKLRKFFTKNNPLILVNLGPGIFENAIVDTNIFIIQKTSNKNQLLVGTIREKDIDIERNFKVSSFLLEKLGENAWFIESKAEQRLKDKIERIGKPLKDWDIKIYYGIKTGLNDAFIINEGKKQEIINNCKDKNEQKRTEAIIKPILRGRDIKRYYYKWAGVYVIFIPAGWTNKNRRNIEPEFFFKQKFFSIYDHLKKKGDAIESGVLKIKGKGLYKRDDQGDYWWELRPCDYYHEFEKEKIINKNIGKRLAFSIAEANIFVEASCFFMTGKNLKYVLGFLNSSLNKYYIYKYSDRTGAGDIALKGVFIETFPIPEITNANLTIINNIKTLVDKIITIKKQNLESDTMDIERQIDQLVYQLYGLTDEEIKIVEGVR